MSEENIPKCDITGKNPSDPNAKCTPISPSAPAQAMPGPQASQIQTPVQTPASSGTDVLLTIPGCGHCAAAKETEGIKAGFASGELREVSFYSKEGQDLAIKHNLKGAPNIIHAGEVCKVSTEGQGLCDKAGVIEYGKKVNPNERPVV